MEKTRFGILHKYTITVMGTKYRIKHLELPPGSDYCQHCCCHIQHHRDCLANLVPGHCDRTIGVQCVLKHIDHGKDKI